MTLIGFVVIQNFNLLTARIISLYNLIFRMAKFTKCILIHVYKRGCFLRRQGRSAIRQLALKRLLASRTTAGPRPRILKHFQRILIRIRKEFLRVGAIAGSSFYCSVNITRRILNGNDSGILDHDQLAVALQVLVLHEHFGVDSVEASREVGELVVDFEE